MNASITLCSCRWRTNRDNVLKMTLSRSRWMNMCGVCVWERELSSGIWERKEQSCKCHVMKRIKYIKAMASTALNLIQQSVRFGNIYGMCGCAVQSAAFFARCQQHHPPFYRWRKDYCHKTAGANGCHRSHCSSSSSSSNSSIPRQMAANIGHETMKQALIGPLNFEHGLALQLHYSPRNPCTHTYSSIFHLYYLELGCFFFVYSF